MSEVWAEIDVRSTGSNAIVVAGLEPFVRLVLQAQKLGWRGARVLGQSEQADLLMRSLERVRSSPGFVVELDVGDRSVKAGGPGIDGQARRTIPLDGASLYSSESLREAALQDSVPAPGCNIAGKSDIGRGISYLLSLARKPIRMDGVIAYFIMRPLSRVLTRVLLRTSVSPNAITLLALTAGLVGATLVFLQAGPRPLALAGGLYFLTGVLDCVDGDLARLRHQGSRLGQWLDSMTDEATTMSLLLALSAFLLPQTRWLGIAGLCCAAVGLVTLFTMYRELSRRKLPIDTAVFPWFFWDDYPDSPDERSLRARIVDGMGYLTRRDVNVTSIAILLVVGLPVVAVCLLSAGYLIFAALLVVHSIVMQRNRANADS